MNELDRRAIDTVIKHIDQKIKNETNSVWSTKSWTDFKRRKGRVEALGELRNDILNAIKKPENSDDKD